MRAPPDDAWSFRDGSRAGYKIAAMIWHHWSAADNGGLRTGAEGAP